MKRLPLIVLADDLTGAAEIAAIAHASGLRAVVHTSLPAGPIEADVIVCDTDTRLATPSKAATRVRSFTKKLSRWPHAGFFKKIDSVLRGNVLAEIEACVGALNLSRTLVVPCNPSLGRIIHNGEYFISNVPLHKTNFARDPHHPRLTSNVRKLVAGRRTAGIVSSQPADRLPPDGIIIGEADTPADVALWAGQVTDETLPVGGADFFRMWLARKHRAQRSITPTALESGNAILLSGTAARNNPLTPLPGPVLALEERHFVSRRALFDVVEDALKNSGCASIHTGGVIAATRQTPAVVGRTFVRLALDLKHANVFTHLLVAGGATAAAVLKALEWTEFKVLRAWGPGVVTLQPVNSPAVTVTLKPGSYIWPASVCDYFHSEIYPANV